MGFITAVKTCFSKYATFSGRAPRSEYWFWRLFYFITYICLLILDGVVFGTYPMGSDGLGIFFPIFFVVTLLPDFAVTARRFHDIGRTGWWILWFFLLVIGVQILGLLLMMFTVISSGIGDITPLTILENPNVILIMLSGIVGVVSAVGIYIWEIVWLVTASHAGENRFGPNPLETLVDESELK